MTRRIIPNDVFMPEIIRLMDEGHTVTITLKGFSMRPALENNRDRAILTKAKDIKIGDIVLAKVGNKYVFHRLIDIRNGIATLRGDGNIATEQCRIDDIKGMAMGFYRKGRDTLLSVNSHQWRTYSYIWTRLYPIRRHILKLYRRVWLKYFKPI